MKNNCENSITNVNKIVEYLSLVHEARTSYSAHIEDNNDSLKLSWCDDCQEINLWTYWQGRGHLDAKIMLVGQDWGCPWDNDAEKLMGTICAMNRNENAHYMDENANITDAHLIELFKSLGYQICDNHPKNADLFFTNLVLGYRNHGSSGKYKASWAKKDAKYFLRLVKIINPEVILCLGRSTFNGVINALDVKQKPVIHAFNDFITSRENPIKVEIEHQTIHIFALAHCGVMGTLNRNRGISGAGLDIAPQISDWKKIKAYL